MGEPKDQGKGGAGPPSDPDQQSTDLWDRNDLKSETAIPRRCGRVYGVSNVWRIG